MITVVNFNLYRFRLKKSKDSLLGTSSIYFTRFQVVSSVEQFMSVHVSDKKKLRDNNNKNDTFI